MDLRLQLTLAGVAMGIAIAVLWLPPEAPPPRPATAATPSVEHVVPYAADVPAGRRGLLLGVDGKPAPGVDVYFTLAGPHGGQVYATVRTNHLGQFAIGVRPGRYRVQALHGFDGAVDHEIDVPEATHPDIELRAAKVELSHRIVSPPATQHVGAR